MNKEIAMRISGPLWYDESIIETRECKSKNKDAPYTYDFLNRLKKDGYTVDFKNECWFGRDQSVVITHSSGKYVIIDGSDKETITITAKVKPGDYENLSFAFFDDIREFERFFDNLNIMLLEIISEYDEEVLYEDDDNVDETHIS